MTPRDIEEQELPGIGRRYQLSCSDHTNVVVIIHHSGRRDLYVMDEGGDEPRAALTLSDRQARSLGAILGGAYFTPTVVEEMEAVIGGLLIDWVTVRPTSPGVDRSIAELEIRQRTRMTVAAISRDGNAIIAPEPGEVIRAGDRLVMMGRREDLAGFERLVIGAGDG